MATIAAPLIAAAIPLLQPLISNLVMHVEKLFGAKTGSTKFQTVLDAILPIATSLGTAGKLPGQLDAATIGTLIESTVQSLKASGVLNPTTADAVVNAISSVGLPTPANAPAAGNTLRILSGTLTVG